MSLEFNPEYYLAHNPDVAKAVDNGVFASAEDHWALFGAQEGRNPNAVFNTSFYLEAYPDVAASDMNPLDHFLQFGAAENRAPNASYADVAADFDAADYLAVNDDVAAAVENGDFVSAYQHWVLFGQFEDGRGDVTFDGGKPVEGVIADNATDNDEDGDDTDGDDNDAGIPGETFDLTTGADRIEGTSDDDVFNAGLGQENGYIVNTLSSADVIDGGAGNDTLNAVLSQEAGIGGETLNVQPTTTSVENINIEARSSNNGDVETGEGAAGTVTLDAKDMTGVNVFGSDYSDGDLVIQNVNTLDDNGNARNTSDITVRMDHTSNFDSIKDASDLTVLFDDDYLLAGQTTSASQANYWLLDQDSPDYENEPLLHAERNGIEFNLAGENYKIIANEEDAEAANTWQEFAQLMQIGIDRRVADGDDNLKDVTVVVDPDNIRQTYNDAGDLVTIPAITVIDGRGRDIEPTGFHTPEKATGGYNIFGRYDNVPSESTDQPVSVNVELDKVGRAGQGGNLKIGGKSQAIVDGQKNGIEVFNIDVLGDESRPSSLGKIESTNGTLKTINIATASEFAGSDSVASLTVRGFDALNVDADGNATGDVYRPFGENVDMINATQFEGDLTIGTEAQEGSYAQNVNLNADGALGDVTYNAEYDATEAQGIIKTGEGDDVINLIGDGNAVITTGAGDDTIFGGTVSIDVDAGAGNDAVYVDNTGEKGVIESFDTGVLAQGEGAATYGLLFGRTVTVTVNGIDATAEVEANNVEGSRYLTNQADLNDAIIKAVEESEALSDLVEVEVVNGELKFTSKIDGENSVQIGVGESDWSESDLEALQSEYRAANSDSGLTVTDQTEVESNDTLVGTISEADNSNTVRLGAGEDTVVLSTSESASDTVVFDGPFGNTSLLNFNVATDRLNFDAVLTGMQSASGSDESAQRIDTTFGEDLTLSANEVNAQTFAGTDTVKTFADLNSGNLLDVFDFNTANYTNSNTNVQLVNGNGNAIVMVQNDENPGEYKVFNVSFNGTDESFELSSGNVTDLGTLDLGSETAADANAAIEAGIVNYNDDVQAPDAGDDNGDNGNDEATDYTFADAVAAQDAGTLEDSYNITDVAEQFQDVTVADAPSADALALISGAANADEFGGYTLADSFANLTDPANAEVVGEAASYELTDDAADIDYGNLTEDEQAFVDGAENGADYNGGTVEPGDANIIEVTDAVDGTMSGTDGAQDVFVFDVQSNENGAFAEFGEIVIDGYNQGEGDTVLFVDQNNSWTTVEDFVAAGISQNGGNGLIEFNIPMATPEQPQSIEIVGGEYPAFDNDTLGEFGNVSFDVATQDQIGAEELGLQGYVNNNIVEVA